MVTGGRDEERLTADMLLAVRRHNAAASETEARRHREWFEADLAEMMEGLRLGLGASHEDDRDEPNKLYRALREAGADAVEARQIAQKHLDRLFRYLVGMILEDETILHRNVAPLINSLYSDRERSWDTLGNAKREVWQRLGNRGRTPSFTVIDPEAAGAGIANAVSDVEDPAPAVAAVVAASDLKAREAAALTGAVDELGPAHGLVFRLAYDPRSFDAFRIPPKAVSGLLRLVIADESETGEDLRQLPEKVSLRPHGKNTVSQLTLKSAMIVAEYWFADHPDLRDRAWTEANVRRIVSEIDARLSKELGATISRRRAKQHG